MNLEVFQKLEKRQIKNDLALPFWLFETEEVIVSKKRFIKAFLFNKEFDHKNIEQITFMRNGIEYSSDKFNVVSEYKDENIVGVAFEIPADGLNTDITILKEIVDNKTYSSSGNVVTYSENKSPSEDDYLKEKFEGYKTHHTVYPSITDKYWQCSCGRIHRIDCNECSCGLTKEVAEEIINFNFEENHIRDWCEKTIEFDVNKSFKENIDDFTNNFSTKYGIEGQKLLNCLNIDEENDKYAKLVEEDKAEKKEAKKRNTIIKIVCTIVIVTLTCVFTLIPNCRSYFNYRFLTNNYQEKYKGLSALNVLDSQEQANKFFKKEAESLFSEKSYKTVLSMIKNDSKYVTSIDESTEGFVFHDKDLEKIYKESLYQLSLENLNNGTDIESTITVFDGLGDYKDSSQKLKDAKWAYIKENFDSTNLETYKYLKELKSENYHGADDAFKELYDWKVYITINNNLRIKYYGDAEASISVSGGEPDETKKMRHKITYANGDIEYGDWITVHSGYNEWSFSFNSNSLVRPGWFQSDTKVEVLSEDRQVLGYTYAIVFKNSN